MRIYRNYLVNGRQDQTNRDPTRLAVPNDGGLLAEGLSRNGGTVAQQNWSLLVVRDKDGMQSCTLISTSIWA